MVRSEYAISCHYFPLLAVTRWQSMGVVAKLKVNG